VFLKKKWCPNIGQDEALYITEQTVHCSLLMTEIYKQFSVQYMAREEKENRKADMILNCRSLLALVLLCKINESEKVQRAEASYEPEEAVQMAFIQVVRDPPDLTPLSRKIRHQCQYERAEIASERHGDKGESGAQTSHGIRRLVVEELGLPNGREHLTDADQQVLRRLPKNAHGYMHLLMDQTL
jgi:hypothetical protein